MAAYHLDAEAFPLPVHIQDNDWQDLIEQAMLQCTGNVREFWSGIPMLIEDFPSLEEARVATPPIPPNVLGLYIGEPPENGDPWQVRPEGIRLFRKNLVHCVDKEDLVTSIATLLAEEAAGWLGLPVDMQHHSSLL